MNDKIYAYFGPAMLLAVCSLVFIVVMQIPNEKNK